VNQLTDQKYHGRHMGPISHLVKPLEPARSATSPSLMDGSPCWDSEWSIRPDYQTSGRRMDITTALADACSENGIISLPRHLCSGAPSAESATRRQFRPTAKTVGNALSAYSIRLGQVCWRAVVKATAE
jgi:hypothetical protein